MTINLNTINTSVILVIFITLFLTSLNNNNNNNNNNYIYIRNIEKINSSLICIKSLAFLSLINLILFSFYNNNNIINLLNWNNLFNINFNISIFIDQNFMFFCTIALLVTWSIIEFSIYYMNNDPLSNNFLRLLIIFLLNMIILTSANNIFMFFIGWEGVGFLSFLLISWWYTRNDANNAAIQAIIYNRIGDIGIILLISSLLIFTNGWNITNLNIINNENNWHNIILISALVGAIGKSAQFSLHPWLPAAMEGPTPVSALLHSSTMVVAGVFLLIRIETNTNPSNLFLTSCSIIGALTAIFAATSAFRQHDIKKIIAYSTTSQLGIMVLAIGLNNPTIALFHICTHAFFKAMLFLCSGSIIHSHNNEQDLRNISNINSSLPITSACLLLGSVSLMGTPFLSGFFSKDLILETIIENPNNLISFILAISATFLTAAYSFRIITFCFNNNNNNNSLIPLNEENPNLYFPITRLAIGTIMSGWILSNWLIITPAIFPSTLIKNIPSAVSIIGALIASTIILSINTNLNISFFSKTWFFTNISHTSTNNFISNIALVLSTRTLDRGWNELIGGQGIYSINNKISQNNQLIQNSYIKNYLLSILVLSISVAYLTITL